MKEEGITLWFNGCRIQYSANLKVLNMLFDSDVSLCIIHALLVEFTCHKFIPSGFISVNNSFPTNIDTLV